MDPGHAQQCCFGPWKNELARKSMHQRCLAIPDQTPTLRVYSHTESPVNIVTRSVSLNVVISRNNQALRRHSRRFQPKSQTSVGSPGGARCYSLGWSEAQPQDGECVSEQSPGG